MKGSAPREQERLDRARSVHRSPLALGCTSIPASPLPHRLPALTPLRHAVLSPSPPSFCSLDPVAEKINEAHLGMHSSGAIPPACSRFLSLSTVFSRVFPLSPIFSPSLHHHLSSSRVLPTSSHLPAFLFLYLDLAQALESFALVSSDVMTLLPFPFPLSQPFSPPSLYALFLCACVSCSLPIRFLQEQVSSDDAMFDRGLWSANGAPKNSETMAFRRRD